MLTRPAAAAVPRTVMVASEVEMMVSAGEVMRREGGVPGLAAGASCRVTLIDFEAVVPAVSRPVNVRTFTPVFRGMAATDQDCEPDAVPDGPRALRQAYVTVPLPRDIRPAAWREEAVVLNASGAGSVTAIASAAGGSAGAAGVWGV